MRHTIYEDTILRLSLFALRYTGFGIAILGVSAWVNEDVHSELDSFVPGNNSRNLQDAGSSNIDSH